MQSTIDLHNRIAEKKYDQHNLLLVRVRSLDTRTNYLYQRLCKLFHIAIIFLVDLVNWAWPCFSVFKQSVGRLVYQTKETPQNGDFLIAYLNKSYCIYLKKKKKKRIITWYIFYWSIVLSIIFWRIVWLCCQNLLSKMLT